MSGATFPDNTFPDENSANLHRFSTNRPQIDPKQIPNLPQTDLKSIPKSARNVPEIDPKPTPNRPQTDLKPTPN